MVTGHQIYQLTNYRACVAGSLFPFFWHIKGDIPVTIVCHANWPDMLTEQPMIGHAISLSVMEFANLACFYKTHRYSCREVQYSSSMSIVIRWPILVGVDKDIEHFVPLGQPRSYTHDACCVIPGHRFELVKQEETWCILLVLCTCRAHAAMGC